MGDVDAGGRVGADQLSVQIDVHVVLIGLSPVYAQGLRTVLTGAGLRCSVLQRNGDLSALLVPSASAVVLLSPDGGAALPPVPTGTHSALAVVQVLADPSTQAYSDALRNGATGVLLYDADLAQTLLTVRCAALGLSLLPVEVARALNQASPHPPPDLEPRDLDALRRLATGATVAALARRYGVSDREMYRSLSSVYRRLGAQNRTQALLIAHGLGLLRKRHDDRDPLT